jgi:hypothetical protein
MVIAIDFDGTCVTHEYPKIGKDIGAIPVLKELVHNGHQLILYTMRDGVELEKAINWFKINDIPLYGVNNNPEQSQWTKSPKVYANLYIDDGGCNIPLKKDSLSRRPYVDWNSVVNVLMYYGLITIGQNKYINNI